MGIFSKIKASYQKIFFEVLKSGKFHGRNIKKSQFFRQFWRLVLVESQDPDVKDMKPLSIERTFKAINMAYINTEKDKNILDKPYICPYDASEFKSEIDLDLHMFQEHGVKSGKEKLIIERYSFIKPFLDKGILSKKEIMESPMNNGVSNHTIYKWILVYKKKGINGFQKKRETRKRTSRFPSAIYQILKDKVTNFDESVMSMNQCWKQIVKECRTIGYEFPQIPSYQTVRTKINEIKKLQKSNIDGYI